jgi:hypothetical protein
VQTRAQEELWRKAVSRDAGTRWPYRGRSSDDRRNADARGAEEREGSAVGRGVKGTGRRWADVATPCRENMSGAGGAAVRQLRTDSPGSSGTARGRRRRPLRKKAVDEIRRHCELFVKDLEVPRCEQTMVLAKAEVGV